MNKRDLEAEVALLRKELAVALANEKYYQERMWAVNRKYNRLFLETAAIREMTDQVGR